MGVWAKFNSLLNRIARGNKPPQNTPNFYMGQSMGRAELNPLNPNADYTLENTPLPESDDYIYDKRYSSHVEIYDRATRYFMECPQMSNVIRRLVSETLRGGVEFFDLFQTKCPRCGSEYETSVTKCEVCGYDGEMAIPDRTERKLFINWRGNSMIDEANKNCQSLRDVLESVLLLALTYNQTLILCRSTYALNKRDMSVVRQYPNELMPIQPSKAIKLHDDTGAPGNHVGFLMNDRTQEYDLHDEKYNKGYANGMRLYPALWRISFSDGGGGKCWFYGEDEIFNKIFSVPSLTYGMPICMYVETQIKTLIACDKRAEVFYATGHPSGLLAIGPIQDEQVNAIERTVRNKMTRDPFTIPIIGMPPGGDNRVVKWIEFGSIPTADMMAVRSEMTQTLNGAFGASGIFMGDESAIKGNSNDKEQVVLMERTVTDLRVYANSFLKWVARKWGLKTQSVRINVPSDEQTKKNMEDMNKLLINERYALENGHTVYSTANGRLDISNEPTFDNPLFSQKNGGGGMMKIGSSVPEESESMLFDTYTGDSSSSNSMVRDKYNREKSVPAEDVAKVIIELNKRGYSVK